MTTKFFFFLLLLSSITWAMQVQATGIEIGTDRVVGEGATVLLHADISIEGLRDEEYTIKWYKRLYNQTDYEIMPFAEGATDVTLNPTETTYVKAIVNEAMGSNCYDEMLVVVAKVYKVGFDGDTPIYIDPSDPTAAPDLYVEGTFPAKAHYIKTAGGSVVTKPACYNRNTAPRVQLMITAADLSPELLATLKIKASLSGTSIAGASYNATLSQTGLVPMNSGSISGYGFAAPLTATAPLPNQIDIFEPLQINWEVSDDAGIIWTNLTNTTPTQTPVYVTLGTPVFAEDTYPFRTTLDISCRNAKGLNSDNLENVVKAIYTEFTDQNISTFNGTVLQFWGNQSLTGFNMPDETQELLYHKDGPCNTWAKFFIDMLKIQGFTNGGGANQYEKVSVSVTADEILPDNGIFTNAIAQQALTNPLYNAPYTLGVAANNPDPAAAVFYLKNLAISPNSFHNVTGGYPGTLDGITGQVAQAQGYAANTYPRMTNFTNHAIVEFAGKYYDPSYGTTIAGQPFNNLIEWENGSIVGFGSFFCPGQAGLNCRYEVPALQRIFWFNQANNTSTQDLVIGTSPY